VLLGPRSVQVCKSVSVSRSTLIRKWPVYELSVRSRAVSERRTELFLFRFEWYEAEYERDDGGDDEDDQRHVL